MIRVLGVEDMRAKRIKQWHETMVEGAPDVDQRLRHGDALPDVEILIVGAGISGIGAGIELLRRGNRSFALARGGERRLAAPGATTRTPASPSISLRSRIATRSRPTIRGRASLRPAPRSSATSAHCAEKYGVTRHIRYGSRAVRCQFDTARDTWTTQLDDGTVVTSRYLIAATGLLSQPKLPEIPGLETFAGKAMHTARWDHDHDLTSKRVAVIGTGASAVQVVPEIAPLVGAAAGLSAHADLDQSANWTDRCSPDLASSLRQFVRDSFAAAACLRVEPRVPHLLDRQLPAIPVRRPAGAAKRPLLDAADRSGTARLPPGCLPGYGLGCKRPTMSNEYLPRSIATTCGWSRNRSSASARRASSPLTRPCTRWTRSSWRPGS